jgi:uncharacterized protein YbgA (DUF1722 family)/uncharacterized protein YbbK (DUF523 family)
MTEDNQVQPLIPIGISSCLIGEPVRFDGGHKQNRYTLDTLRQYFNFRAFCPEVAIGLGTPRPSIRLINEDNQVQAVGTKDNTLRVTDPLIEVAKEQSDWQRNMCGYIVKKGSRSCGMEPVKIYNNGIPNQFGAGLYTQTLMENFPNFPVEEEGRLGDPWLRENFIKRVFILSRWKHICNAGLSWQALMSFHAQHKLILFSHNQTLARQLGKQLATATDQPLNEYEAVYLTQFMSILKKPAKRSNHVDVLEHIRGYLKHELDKDDKQELTDSIENYRLGHLPLIVPITLLKHHFRKFPNDYIEKSFYMHPHPKPLMLLTTL